ncbi:hypothetical protein F1880_005584 [Penicillium rolfsii]|nr:hypothetical protein F1880_005584 [Penicillium rolfsii]
METRATTTTTTNNNDNDNNNSHQEFHFFSQLPTELRLAIWRICLPNRVVEIDLPWDDGVDFYPNLPPCELRQTTHINRRAPLISRVCHESRLVAFETGYYRDDSSPPQEALWKSDLLVKRTWLDPCRDIILLNWTPTYEAGYYGQGSALDFLAWNAAKARGGAFMFDYLDSTLDGQVDLRERIGALQKLQYVVMHLIVVHTTFKTAVKTGLFGLLGDACIQLVDVSDEARLNALFDFAEKCESEANGSLTSKQDFRRQSPESVRKILNDKLADEFGAKATHNLSLRPAIMFRFCPHFCNHSIGSIPRAQYVDNNRAVNRRQSLSVGRQTFGSFIESLFLR